MGVMPVALQCTGLHQPSFLTIRKCLGMKLWVQVTAAKSSRKSIADNFRQMKVLSTLSSGSIDIDIGNNICKHH